MSNAFVLQPTYSLAVGINQPKHFIVVGAGGNGGYYIPHLARMVSIQNHRLRLAGVQPHQITIIEADNVEDKNLTRQNFLRNDVDKNKGEVMASRYGRAFGIEIAHVNAYLDSPKMLEEIIRSKPGTTPVIVGAVDNNKTRALIYEAYKNHNNIFWLDAGNEEFGGQVVLGYRCHKRKPDPAVKVPQLFEMPCVAELYPEILLAQDKLPHELSCAERAVSAPQNIYTNMTAANLMIGFTNLLLTANEREGKGIKYHAVAFNAEVGSFTNRLNTMSNLDVKEPEIPAPAAEEKEVSEVAVVEVEAPAKKAKRTRKAVAAE